jgi:hypothetical protein
MIDIHHPTASQALLQSRPNAMAMPACLINQRECLRLMPPPTSTQISSTIISSKISNAAASSSFAAIFAFMLLPEITFAAFFNPCR